MQLLKKAARGFLSCSGQNDAAFLYFFLNVYGGDSKRFGSVGCQASRKDFAAGAELCTVVPEAFLHSLLANFATQTAFSFFLLARSAESAESFLFRLGWALRSALRVANFQIKRKIISKESLWYQCRSCDVEGSVL